MKEQIMQNISAVIAALNCVTVSGKDNLGNIAGSISVLEDVYRALAGVEFAEPKSASEDEAGCA